MKKDMSSSLYLGKDKLKFFEDVLKSLDARRRYNIVVLTAFTDGYSLRELASLVTQYIYVQKFFIYVDSLEIKRHKISTIKSIRTGIRRSLGKIDTEFDIFSVTNSNAIFHAKAI